MYVNQTSVRIGIFFLSVIATFTHHPASAANPSVESNQFQSNQIKQNDSKQNILPTINQNTKPLLEMAKSTSQKQFESVKQPSQMVIQKTFIYGQKRPTIYCAPLHLCDVRLEPGEVVQNVLAGDTIRWKILPALSNSGSNQTVHVAIKPTEYNIETNVLITTNRRSYEWRLVSIRENAHIPLTHAKFEYPENEQNAWLAQQQTMSSKQGVANLSVSPEELNFNYSIQCNWQAKSFCPLRVFDDKRKVYIQMPSSFRYRQAPVLLLRNKDHKTSLVNYRLQDNFYVVDGLFRQAILVVGVGKEHQQITITRHCQKAWVFGRCQNE